MKKQRLPFEEFKEIYRRVPRLTVEILVEIGEGLVFTLRKIEPNIGEWHIPGGTVLFGETLNEAVKRVAKDELGVEVKVGKFVGYIEYPEGYKEGRFDWAIGIAFLTNIKKGSLKGSYQGEEIKIFDQIPQNMISDQKRFLKKYKLLK